MGLFSRKRDAPERKRGDLIPCDKMIPSPPDRSQPKPPAPLKPDQEKMYRQVLAHFQNPALQIPVDTSDNAATKPLRSWEKFWLTRECILRYLRAMKWDVNNAIRHLTKTLCWRREVGITHGEEDNHLTGETVAVENETGKELLLGFDQSRRPLFYLKNGRQNTESSFRQVQHLIFMMESAVSLTPQGVENIDVLVDFKGYKEPGIVNDKAPPISISKMCLNVMQDHYPERLARCVLINIPWFIWAFVKIMYPFLDPNTKEKVLIDEPFEKLAIDADQLEANYNGRLDFHYKHDVYWPDMIEKLDSLRATQYERFLKLGGVVGLSEWDIKGTHENPLFPVGS